MARPSRRAAPARSQARSDHAPAADAPPGAVTRQRLLDVAERLFAEQSYEATSLRQLTTAAGANLAAVHYHFGSKEGLFRAVFARRAGPINASRLARLAALEARAEPPSIEELLVALIAPALELYADPEWRWYMQLVGRAFTEPGDQWLEADREFEPTHAAFTAAFARALPVLDARTLETRLFFTLGVQCIVLAIGQASGREGCAARAAADPEVLLQELVAFAAAGLRAPPIASPPRAPGATG